MAGKAFAEDGASGEGLAEGASRPGGAAPAPELTIAVPAYNVEAYLDRGLSSLDDPRFEGKLEVVVVDDGSTDGTRALAERYAARRPGVFRVISQANRGHGGAVNTALAAARGRWFRIVDGDDWVDADSLAALLADLAALSCDLVVDVKTEVDASTGEQTVFGLPVGVEPGATVPFGRVAADAEAAVQLKIHTLTARTAYLRAHGVHLLEHTFYEDTEYAVKASAPASTIAFLDLPVYRYLVGRADQSVSRASYVRRWGDHTRVVDELLGYLAASERAAARGEKGSLSGTALAYLRWRVQLLIDTHYNIALLFDDDRRRGRRRAREFRAELRGRDAGLWRRGEKRYRTALALNLLGLSYASIERLVAGRRR